MKTTKKISIINLIPISGLFLGLSWPPSHNYLLLFIAFVPLLCILNKHTYCTWKIFVISFINFLTFTLITLYWIYNAGQEFGMGVSLALVGAVSIVTSILMSLIVSVSYYISTILRTKLYLYSSLIAIWLSYEYLNFNWDLHFPWLSLGNGLVVKHQIIQWYEFTGVLGGSLWVLLVNILIYEVLISKHIKTLKIKIIALLTIVIVPTYISSTIYANYKSPGTNTIKVAIVQPNLDPYKQKFDRSMLNNNLNNIIELTERIVTEDTKLVVWPETVFFDPVNENHIINNRLISHLRKTILNKPNISLITGITTTKYDDNDYKVYNSAILLKGPDKDIQIYHKNKLVPFVESMPYPQIMANVNKLIPIWGNGGLYTASNESNLFKVNDLKIAIGICYDSIFGNLIASSVNKGANLISIITNDGWWKDTDGYKQHALYAKLLAIANRKSVVRSANTGISEFVNERGDILQATKWNEAIAISSDITINDSQTFYSKHNDYIAIIAIYIFALLLIMASIYKLKVYTCKYRN